MEGFALKYNDGLFVWLKRALDVFWYLGLLFLIIVLVVFFFFPAFIGETGFTVKHLSLTPETSISGSSAADGITAVELVGVKGDVKLSFESGEAKLLTLLFMLFITGMNLFFIHLLRALLKDFVRGNAFSYKTVWRLRSAAWVILINFVADWLIVRSMQTYMANTVSLEGFELTGLEFTWTFGLLPNVGSSSFFVVLAFLVVAELVARAFALQNERNTLREEQSLTV